MQTQYINLLLDLPEVQITNIIPVSTDEVHIEVVPVMERQSCPTCQSVEFVTRKGNNGIRTIRHIAAFEKKTYLLVPAIRMYCTACAAGFVWDYPFVGPKKRYSHLFHKQAVEQALGATVVHSARIQKAPISTIQRMHNTALSLESERLYEQAWKEAKEKSGLVLGVDDFAIKKGHSYNTGIHNLKGETLLDILPGRKLEELRAYAQQHPSFLNLTPKAVVMDLAPAYHTWISECFPGAIRIADRFHVHGYVIESVQAVRKAVQSTLSPRAKARLKAYHRLLNPKRESLTEQSKKWLDELLHYSPLLRSVWMWKESFTEWYDCSPHVEVAIMGFHRWCEQGERIDHEAVRNTLKTMRNWQAEIINYHRCRWTNAIVEGRHNRIKAFQRRHYFTRNRVRYKAGILIECNHNRLYG
jgi:transposase